MTSIELQAKAEHYSGLYFKNPQFQSIAEAAYIAGFLTSENSQQKESDTLKELLELKRSEVQKHLDENLKDRIEAMEAIRDRDAIIRVLNLLGVS